MSYRALIGCVMMAIAVTLSAVWVVPKVAANDEAAVRVRSRASTSYTRQEIKQMPILKRPSRPGHFYGNTVRRRYYRSHSG